MKDLNEGILFEFVERAATGFRVGELVEAGCHFGSGSSESCRKERRRLAKAIGICRDCRAPCAMTSKGTIGVRCSRCNTNNNTRSAARKAAAASAP